LARSARRMACAHHHGAMAKSQACYGARCRPSLRLSLIVTAIATVWVIGCGGTGRDPVLDDLSERYVHLALALGQRDPDFIDAYHGPPAWKTQAQAERHSLESIQRRGEEIIAAMGQRVSGSMSARRRALERQVRAVAFRAAFLAGKRSAFDEEMAALFDVVVPRRTERELDAAVGRVERLLPGHGPLAARYGAWLKSFTVAPERVPAVLDAALLICRERTLARIRLPPSEALSVEFIPDRAWNAFTVYQGNFHSRVQVDSTSPLTVDRILDLACHEGYPGHHTISVLADEALARGRGWVEFTIEPLYGPRAFLMEGAASLGPDLALPADTRLGQEWNRLFALAELDPGRAAQLAPMRDAVNGLAPAIVEGVRRYLDGQLDAPRFMFWLERYALMAEQEGMLKFVNRFRGYALAYHEGAALVRAHLDAATAQPDPIAQRWERFRTLVTSPLVPGDLSSASTGRRAAPAAMPPP
jgi:hypothetical protein